MTVGGDIVYVKTLDDGNLLITVLDGADRCQVIVDPEDYTPRPGDVVWWQNSKAYWCPKSGPHDGKQDIPLRKIGFSGWFSQLNTGTLYEGYNDRLEYVGGATL